MKDLNNLLDFLTNSPYGFSFSVIIVLLIIYTIITIETLPGCMCRSPQPFQTFLRGLRCQKCKNKIKL